ncbi:hypothetical protein AUJ68_05335 [Candidatus Woesearchaeota archaeon CG1_02_57_44]|nr:MAG: hypothetical protein AUJ68_05335 [Candidatus Woesearchaeota archaeon CG1_02_57_44]
MFRILDHYTADVGVDIEADAPGGLFAEACRALAQITMDPDSVVPAQSRTLCIEKRPFDLLLFEFLEELIYLRDAEQFLSIDADCEVMQDPSDTTLWSLHAEVRGEPIDHKRHKLKVEIKAVTFHDFHAEPTRARVVFDI